MASDDPLPETSPYLDPQNIAFGQQFAALLPAGKQLTDIPIAQAREVFGKAQARTPDPRVSVTDFLVPTSFGEVKTSLYKPREHDSSDQDLPLIFYLHGGGWFLGDAFDYEPIVDDLVVRTGFAVVFPEYTLAPERQFPAQQEQCLQVLEYIVQNGSSRGVKTDRLVIVGDSAGAQLATALAVLTRERELKLKIVHQVLLHPVVNLLSFGDTFSEFEFQNGPLISNAFIQEAATAFIPTVSDRSTITASPALMTASQLAEFMPPTTIVTAGADWLRDEGEKFAQQLQTAGVECGVVRGIACLHDAEVFVVSRKSPTAKLVMIMVAGKLREVLLGEQ
ncbi:hypothetical protein LTR36_008013 [Oleoguttula mirabilis]|uniref:Alpha/beta hydrolase fold-3 domain-containing protein n=1 Tax=Oleoguttula mirabilis TaxID=1507867 RepID=A0AAV9J8I9_9PEZI|nr:hypothetical protein LTR36_008013 [Oleoguttula mirabilis]